MVSLHKYWLIGFVSLLVVSMLANVYFLIRVSSSEGKTILLERKASKAEGRAAVIIEEIPKIKKDIEAKKMVVVVVKTAATRIRKKASAKIKVIKNAKSWKDIDSIAGVSGPTIVGN